MSLSDYARAELQREGLFDDDADYGGMLGQAVMDLIDLFAMQGHSGYSAHLTVELFTRLARYQPLSALTDDPAEWGEVMDDLWQSRRDPAAFSKDGGKTYTRTDEPEIVHESTPHVVPDGREPF